MRTTVKIANLLFISLYYIFYLELELYMNTGQIALTYNILLFPLLIPLYIGLIGEALLYAHETDKRET